MGQKYPFYVDLNSKKIYEDWGVCAELKKKGGTNFKGFMTREEALPYIECEDSTDSGASENIIQNLKNCIKRCECSEAQKQILLKIADSIELNNDYDLSGLDAELEEFCETHQDVDAVFFADGSADKDKVTGLSEKIGIGLVVIDVKEKSIQAYEHKISKDTGNDLDWVLKGSNDSAEMIAAISSIRLSHKKGYNKIRIYQDNVRPLSYFYGLFKNLNTEVGAWFLDEAMNHVRNMEVKFIYVPAHEKVDGYDNMGGNASLRKVTFNTAKKLNALVDGLANVN